MQLIDFLKQVLPQEGVKCWATISKNKKVIQGFTESFGELAEKIAQANTKGLDTYFACAAFVEAGSRRGENALGAKAFWLDIDCGEEKAQKGLGYASTDIALQKLDDFANAMGLPLPMVVCSGSGLHAYWLLDKLAHAADWLPIARAFKQQTERYGLLADPARTADIASVLRPICTSNFKSDPARLVFLESDDTEVISFEDFSARVSSQQPALNSSLAANILGGRTSALVDGVQEGGRNNACAKFVGILAAKKTLHAQIVSETLAWNAKNKPPLPHDEVLAVIASITRSEAEKPAPPPITLENPLPRPVLPAGYSAQVGGAMFTRFEDEEGIMQTIPMANLECYLVDICRREREAIESYVFTAFHPHNGWHEFLVSREEFEGSSWLATMGKNCTEITNPKLYKNYIRLAALSLKGSKMDSVRYEQFGWKDNYRGFLVGNALIKQGGETQFAYGDESLEPRMKGMKLPKSGSRGAWSIAANKFYRTGFEAHGFGLIASFAAPLMEFVCGATDGGAVLALHTQGSGFGKTNILQAVASVWGSFDALSVSGADTENAKFNIISKACHLPVLEEEMGNNDPAREAAILKRFTTGRDKNRARRDGSVDYKDTRFKTLMISASNHSLADIVRTSGDQGAMARIFEVGIEVPQDKEEFKEFSKISAAMLDNCGYAGREFIFALMLPGVLDWARKKLDAAVLEYQKLLDSSGKDRYVVYMLACCHVAAELVNSKGILTFDTNRIMQWAIQQTKIRAEDTKIDSAIEVLNQFIAENIMDCLTVESAFNSKKPAMVIRYPKNKLVMRLEKDSGKLFISQAAIRLWLTKINSHMGSLAKTLRKEEVLSPNIRQLTLSAGTDYPGARILVWEIDMNHPEVNGMLQLVKTQDELPTSQEKAF